MNLRRELYYYFYYYVLMTYLSRVFNRQQKGKYTQYCIWFDFKSICTCFSMHLMSTRNVYSQPVIEETFLSLIYFFCSKIFRWTKIVQEPLLYSSASIQMPLSQCTRINWKQMWWNGKIQYSLFLFLRPLQQLYTKINIKNYFASMDGFVLTLLEIFVTTIFVSTYSIFREEKRRKKFRYKNEVITLDLIFLTIFNSDL